jgi:hypothetical protein
MKIIQRCFLLITLLLMGAGGYLRADDGNLGKFEREMSKSSPPAPVADQPPEDQDSHRDEHHRQREDDQSDEECDADYCGHGLGSLSALFVLGAPFVGPALLIGDHYDKTYGLAVPYESGRGYLVPTGKSWLVRAETSRIWSTHDTPAWEGSVSLYTSSRFGLDTSYTRYSENVHDDINTLAFLDVVPTFSFARTEKWDWQVGAGYESVQGSDHHDRLKLIYDVKYFFAKHFRLDVDLGTSLASGSTAFEVSPGIAYHWDRFEIKAAYERRSVSDVVLEGPQVSLAVWF